MEPTIEPQHSPLPWTTSFDNIKAEHGIWQVSEGHFWKPIGSVEKEANGAFIVRAVNCHEELVEDLAVCLQSFGKDMQNDFRRRIENHLKKAVAKADMRHSNEL